MQPFKTILRCKWRVYLLIILDLGRGQICCCIGDTIFLLGEFGFG